VILEHKEYDDTAKYKSVVLIQRTISLYVSTYIILHTYVTYCSCLAYRAELGSHLQMLRSRFKNLLSNISWTYRMPSWELARPEFLVKASHVNWACVDCTGWVVRNILTRKSILIYFHWKNSNNILETQEYLENCLLTISINLINTPPERELFQRRLNLNREESMEVGRVGNFAVKCRS
jgi:hypothetical protein